MSDGAEQAADVPPALRGTPAGRSLATRRGLIPLLAVAALVIVFLLFTALTSDPPAPADDITGVRSEGIEFGVDQCPLVSLQELASAMPELGEPTESLATGGPQFVCNFAGTGEPGVSLQVLGGSTGNGGQPEWEEWLNTPPGPERIEEYLINGVPMLLVPATSDGEQVAFRGTDRLVWRVDATLPDLNRARQVELTIARLLAVR